MIFLISRSQIYINSIWLDMFNNNRYEKVISSPEIYPEKVSNADTNILCGKRISYDKIYLSNKV